MENELLYKIDAHRRLCIKKDLIELNMWIDTLTILNTELSQLLVIEKQLLQNITIETTLLGVRRKNTLVLAALCKYEQGLNSEYEYGKVIYDVKRAKEHEKKRDSYTELMHDFYALRKSVYTMLSTYKRN